MNVKPIRVTAMVNIVIATVSFSVYPRTTRQIPAPQCPVTKISLMQKLIFNLKFYN